MRLSDVDVVSNSGSSKAGTGDAATSAHPLIAAVVAPERGWTSGLLNRLALLLCSPVTQEQAASVAGLDRVLIVGPHHLSPPRHRDRGRSVRAPVGTPRSGSGPQARAPSTLTRRPFRSSRGTTAGLPVRAQV
jgi:hypothetical protein